MPYMARLLTITQYESITDDIRPFVEFQAAQKKVELEPRSRLAILQVENIPSYHVVFLESGITMDDIVQELAKQDLTMGEETKKMIGQAMVEK